MRLKEHFPAKLIAAIVAVLASSIGLVSLPAADQPKAGGPGVKSGDAASKAYSLKVDANANFGTFYNPARCYSTSAENTPTKGWGSEDRAQIESLGTDGLVKIWANHTGVEADNYIIDAASRAGEVLLVTYRPTTEQEFYSTIVRVKNLIHGKFKYYQPLNEMFAPPAKVYDVYKEAYRAAYHWNTANPSNTIQMGGPAWAGFKQGDTTAFFTLFKNDPDNTRKRLDFFSVHYYACWDNLGTPGYYDNYRATTQRRDLNDILEKANYERLPKTLPVFIPESSLFGGNERKYHDGTLAEDLIKESSYMVVRNYFLIKYNYNPGDRFFNWVTQKNGGDSSVRKGMIAYGPGVAEGVGTPYLFVMKMMKMLKTTRIYDADPPTPTGYELNCFATKDDTGIAVILVNYQRNNSNTYNVTLDIDNLANTALIATRKSNVMAGGAE